jgi:phosphate-selective porin OprO/OprP
MRRGLAVSVLLLLGMSSAAHAKTLEELLVEKGVITKGEAAAVAGSAPSKVYWNQGTRVDVPDKGFTAKVTTMIQTRYSFTDADEDAGQNNTSSFDVHRARLIVSGTALNREFAYMLSSDFIGADDTESGSAPALRDAYIQWQPFEETQGLRMGQFKTAISRQFNMDQQALQFADRSEVSEYFTLGRQEGALVFSDFADGVVSASAGVFNGNSTGEGENLPGVDTRQTGVASVRVNPVGEMNVYEEGDIDWSEEVAVSLGAAYAYEDAQQEGVDVSNNNLNVDGNVKYLGWSLQSEFFDRDGTQVDSRGFYAQTGYFLVPKKMEFAARYGHIDCNHGKSAGICSGNDAVAEAGATINYYFWRHSLKAQLGYGFLTLDPAAGGSPEAHSNRYLFQLSSYF